ncbi:MAG TPA: adenosylcobinamide-GDP ribazoletransferase [Polyangiaceae bacterium]|nr:adenosylcobinamide-GDP ribazoletransferase [Polyangiaceae bacterium]
MTWPPAVKGARAAAVFLTRLPLGGFPYRKEDWQWASAHFPLVGAGIGVLLASVWWCSRGAGALSQAALCVIAALFITGAFHEDGLADTADALGGDVPRERVFVILKDSRVGSFGAAALCMALVLRVSLLAQLSAIAPLALVVSQCVARLPPVWLMRALPYVSDPALARNKNVARAGTPQTWVASGWVVLLVAVLVSVGALRPVDALALALAAGIAALACGYRFYKRVGGITGDFLGATEQVSECCLLLALAIARAG